MSQRILRQSFSGINAAKVAKTDDVYEASLIT